MEFTRDVKERIVNSYIETIQSGEKNFVTEDYQLVKNPYLSCLSELGIMSQDINIRDMIIELGGEFVTAFRFNGVVYGGALAIDTIDKWNR